MRTSSVRPPVVWCLLLFGAGCCYGHCAFPSFLWQPLQNGTERKWFGRTDYVRNTDSWRKQEEITIGPTEILIELRTQISCSTWSSTGGAREQSTGDKDDDDDDGFDKLVCYKKDVLKKIVCLEEEEEPGSKFRVLDTTRGKSVFNCLKFEDRSRSVVQIYSAVAKETNDDDLCFDDYFERNHWLWIAADRDYYVSVLCSIRGGFDFFESSKSESDERLCPDSWRPSRLEVDCIRSEGMKFNFILNSCNPFSSRTSENFQCAAVWNEQGSKFIVFGYANTQPRYVLTVPEEIDNLDEFSGTLALSPLIPGEGGREEMPPDTGWYQLDITRSEPGVCFDESIVCRQYAKEGKCTNTAVHQYANFCKRSCGLCEFVPSSKAECSFPVELVGFWVMFSEREREEIAVDNEELLFSTLGRFVCKSKHWENDYYKVYSAFQNGCRPRYTCVRLSRTDEGMGLMDISSSDTLDRSFQLCDFDDRQNWPITGRARNWRTKLLLPLSSMLDAKCGVGFWLEAEIQFSNGSRCQGQFWDVDPSTCLPVSRMTIRTARRCQHRLSKQFQCTALAKLSDDTDFLVTLNTISNQTTADSLASRYVCWIHKVENDSDRQTIELKRVRCETGQTQMLRSNEDMEITRIVLFKDQSTDSPCSPSMKETMDEPRLAQPTTSSSTSNWLSVKTLYKPGGFSMSISDLFSYKSSPSVSLQQLRAEGKHRNNGTLEVEKQGVVANEGGVLQNGATNSRIRKEQDLDYAVNGSSNSQHVFSGSFWIKFGSTLIAIVIPVHSLLKPLRIIHWGLRLLGLHCPPIHNRQ